MKGRGLARAALLIAVGLLLAACGTAYGPNYFGGEGPRRALGPHPTYKIGAPYTVKGITYYPHVDLAYDQTGVASWYGEQFQGQYTANGEVYDLNQITAAHKTLPLPSIVEVVNLQNNRAMRVRVNDRGPFADGRVIDVSRRVAQLLGFERNGTAMVRVRILKDESLQAAAAAERGIISNGTTAYASAAPVVTTVAASVPVAAPPAAVPIAAQSAPAQPLVAPPSAIPPAGSPAAPAPGPQTMVVAANVPAPQPPQQIYAPYGGPPPVYQGLPSAPPAVQHHFLVQSPLYRMEIGPVDTQEEADRALAQMLRSGYRDAHIVMN
jgi:rare lipoprotein A